jgi:hypothetical protein
LKKVERRHFFYKKGVELNLPDRGTGIPYRDKRAHAPGREQSAYHLFCKKLPVFYQRFKAIASNIFNTKNRKYMLLKQIYKKNHLLSSLTIFFRQKHRYW